MEKPFDLKDLGQKLSADVPQDAEVIAEKKLKAFFAWIDESAELHPSPLVKGAVAMFSAHIKPLMIAQVDKIDGQAG